MNIGWDATQYNKDFRFVPDYGEDVLALLELHKGMKVLDIGCGTGQLTAKIKESGAEVIGIDMSEQMLETARKEYPGIPFIKKDACALETEEEYDAVFSNAVFHWIDDQDALLEGISRALMPGGVLVCEFGGQGCCETIHGALDWCFRKRGLKYPRTFYFPTIGEYAPLVERHELHVVYATMFERMTKLQGENGLANWIKMFVKAPFEGMQVTQKEEIIAEAVEKQRSLLYRDGTWYADYVRIRLKAIKYE